MHHTYFVQTCPLKYHYLTGMPTQITKIDDDERRVTVFRLAGEVLCEDAKLIARLARESAGLSGFAVEIDLADVSLIDSDAASIFKSLSDEDEYELVGTDQLLQTAIDMAERS